MTIHKDYTIDESRHPKVQEIINFAKHAFGMSHSHLVCAALEQWFVKATKDYNMTLYPAGGNSNNKNVSPSPEQMTMYFENLIPPITEPLSRFRYEDNKLMWQLMSEEFLTHAGKVGHLLMDGEAKTRLEFGGGIDERYDPRIMAVQQKSRENKFPTDDEAFAALATARQQVEQEKHALFVSFIKDQIKENVQYKSIQQRYMERIEELEKEVSRLSTSSSSEQKLEATNQNVV